MCDFASTNVDAYDAALASVLNSERCKGNRGLDRPLFVEVANAIERAIGVHAERDSAIPGEIAARVVQAIRVGRTLAIGDHACRRNAGSFVSPRRWR